MTDDTQPSETVPVDMAQDAPPPLPLAAARTVERPVQRGSWMSVDITPDGGTLIFDLLGQIYTMPATGGEATAMSTLDVLPGYAFTPDSRALIISYGGELWRVPIDGSEPSKIPFTAQVRIEMAPLV